MTVYDARQQEQSMHLNYGYLLPALGNSKNWLSIIRALQQSILILTLPLGAVSADEVIVSAGYGSQPHAKQNNSLAGIDYAFYRYQRSERQFLSVGVSVNHLRTDANQYESLDAISIYPQLTLYATQRHGIKPLFFVRALGPTWISKNRLGERQQEKHITLQAQVGFGVEWGGDHDGWLATVAWKHFSNANLFSENDGIDVPFSIGIGRRW